MPPQSGTIKRWIPVGYLWILRVVPPEEIDDELSVPLLPGFDPLCAPFASCSQTPSSDANSFRTENLKMMKSNNLSVFVNWLSRVPDPAKEWRWWRNPVKSSVSPLAFWWFPKLRNKHVYQLYQLHWVYHQPLSMAPNWSINQSSPYIFRSEIFNLVCFVKYSLYI